MRFLTGRGDERTEMFTNPLWKQLHTTISRYIVPFDAVKHPWDMTLSHRWIAAAEAAHQQILIAFYHSDYSPTRMPSVSEYTNDVKAYLKAFPRIKQYQPWNEANRGNVPHRYASPTASSRPSTTRRSRDSAARARSSASMSWTSRKSPPRCAT